MALLFLVLACAFLRCAQMAEKPNFTITATVLDEHIQLDTSTYIIYTINGTVPIDYDEQLFLSVDPESRIIAKPHDELILLENISQDKGNWLSNGLDRLKGDYLGTTTITMTVGSKFAVTELVVKVVRPERVIDTIFIASAATFVSIFFIMYGCVVDWSEVRMSIRKPLGLSIALFGKFIIMPTFSYGLGVLLYPENPEMQLGLFFTGVSSCVNVSNAWVVISNGDINLSIIITIITTVAAFGVMPLWLFTLGGVVYADANINVPYKEISIYAAGVVVPIVVGCFFQSFCKTVSRFLAPALKFFSVFIILYITVFAFVVHLYLFERLSWRHFVAGLSLPSLGCASTYILAVLFKQSSKTALTIAVETGIQNTGIAILLLRLALPQPESDLVTMVPIYVATMTPVPLLVMLIHQSRCTKQESLLNNETQLNYCNSFTSNENGKGPISMTAQ
ncbi:hypothetical protein FQR65_LT14337 [Abscondita terminalis]|nr:hypothetical protein FQR65_LT14337 [Abscondita terminalis]